MQPIADCECCGTPLDEGDDYDYCPDGIIWVCRACVEAEQDRLREEFGWIGAWTGRPSPSVTRPISQIGKSAATSSKAALRSDTAGPNGD